LAIAAKSFYFCLHRRADRRKR